MSVRSEKLDVQGGIAEVGGAVGGLNLTGAGNNEHVSATINAAQQADSQLGEANAVSTNHPDHPLHRTVVASIRATMSDLCLRRNKSMWAPTAEALRSILQQRKSLSNPHKLVPPVTSLRIIQTNRQVHRRLWLG